MRLDLTPEESEMLEALLEATLRVRLQQTHHAYSRDYRGRLEHESELIQSVRAKLSQKAA